MNIFKLAILALILACLSAPALAQPPVNPSLDGHWVIWEVEGREGRHYYTPGAAAAELSNDQSSTWILEQLKTYPNSRPLTQAAARRFWSMGLEEESLNLMDAALALPDTDYLLEVAHRHLLLGELGPSLAALKAAGPGWLKIQRAAITAHPLLVALQRQGWDLRTETQSLEKGKQQMILSDTVVPTGHLAFIGERPIAIDSTASMIHFMDERVTLTSSQEQNLDQFLGEFASGQVIREQLGTSVEGKTIEAHWMGSGPERVLFFGAFHGDEPESAQLMKSFIKHLSAHPEYLKDKTVIVVPEVNPDGLAKDQRVNARGVDLNRNFPTKNWNNKGKGTRTWGGSQPASEPETKVVVELIDRFQPSRIISVHAPYRNVNYDGPAEALAQAMSRENGYPVEPYIGYPTPGSFGTYAGKERRIPTITLELPKRGTRDVWRDNRGALVKALLFSAR